MEFLPTSCHEFWNILSTRPSARVLAPVEPQRGKHRACETPVYAVSCQDVSANQTGALPLVISGHYSITASTKEHKCPCLPIERRTLSLYSTSFFVELRGLQLPRSSRVMRQLSRPSQPSQGPLIWATQPGSHPWRRSSSLLCVHTNAGVHILYMWHDE